MMTDPGFFDQKDRIFDKDLMSDKQADIATKDFVQFRNELHDKLTHLMIAQFNELQIFLRDHMPKERLTLNLLLATWRATTIDSANTIIQCGDYCEKQYISNHEEKVKKNG